MRNLSNGCCSPRRSRGLFELNLLDNLFPSVFWEPQGDYPQLTRVPSTDVVENEQGYRLTIDLPGLTEKEIDLSIDDGVLTVRAHREEEKETKEESWLVRERRAGGFERSFRLRSTIDRDQVKASYKNGTLVVELPKSEKSKPRQIPIQ